MATVDLGKIKQVFRGTYNNSTAYAVDDLVAFTDGSVTSTYICTTATTGNAPSSGGTAHANWAYVAKGQAISPTTTQGDLVFRGASADQRLAIGTAGQVLKVNSSANGYEFGTGGGMALISEGTGSSNSTTFNVDNVFTNTYKYYKMMYSWSSGSWMKLRFINSSGSVTDAAGYYYAGSWYRRDAGGSHDVGQFGYFNQDHAILGYFDGQTNQPSFGEFNFFAPNDANFKPQFWGSTASKHGGHTKRLDLTSSYDSAYAVRGFQFLSNSGSTYLNTNFNYRLYGFN